MMQHALTQEIIVMAFVKFMGSQTGRVVRIIAGQR